MLQKAGLNLNRVLKMNVLSQASCPGYTEAGKRLFQTPMRRNPRAVDFWGVNSYQVGNKLLHLKTKPEARSQYASGIYRLDTISPIGQYLWGRESDSSFCWPTVSTCLKPSPEATPWYWLFNGRIEALRTRQVFPKRRVQLCAGRGMIISVWH